MGYLLGSDLVTWVDIGILFGVMFGPSGPSWENFGHNFCVQKWDGAPKVLQEAPPPKFPHPFGDLFGFQNHQKSFPEAPQSEF